MTRTPIAACERASALLQLGRSAPVRSVSKDSGCDTIRVHRFVDGPRATRLAPASRARRPHSRTPHYMVRSEHQFYRLTTGGNAHAYQSIFGVGESLAVCQTPARIHGLVDQKRSWFTSVHLVAQVIGCP